VREGEGTVCFRAGVDHRSQNVENKLKIWLITIGEHLPLSPDTPKQRTNILAEKLIGRGHDVIWWTSAFNHYRKRWFFLRDTTLTVNGITIEALKGIGYHKNISLRRFLDHKIIAWKFIRFAERRPAPDIIITSTPPHDLAYAAARYSHKHGIPVIVDIRDEWPDLFLKFIPIRFVRLLKILLIHDFYMVRKTLKMAAGLVAMMDSLLAWGLTYAGRQKSPKDRVFYLGDSKRTTPLEGEKNDSFQISLDKKFVVTFIGTFVQNNDPSILIESAKKLADYPIYFVLAGDGELSSSLKNASAGLSNVLMPGWLNKDEMTFLLKHSKIGVCPTNQNREAFPNKAFSYLSAGIPFLTAFQGEIKNIIEKNKTGFYYPPHDIDAFASCILGLYQNPRLYQEMAENAKNTFNKMFDADKIYDDYAKYIEMIAENKTTFP
jgi:glycosyltransferase involved in cell wall biosynthesis